MIENVTKTFVNFYDKTASGVIMNRFSNDISVMDYMLHFTFIDSIEGPLNFLNLLITVSFITPYFLAIGILEIIILYKWLLFNKNIILQTKFLELLSKSPVFSFF
jgi:ATP-binding cassette subfamily C (CFTR/MRP) protein 4